MSRKCAIVVILLVAAVGLGSWTSADVELPRKSAVIGSITLDRNEAPDVASRLRHTLAAYLGDPSAELAEHVIEAFSAVNEHLADLRQRAAGSTGGLRAELVIEQIELERERDKQMERFSEANARIGRGYEREEEVDDSDGLRFTSMLGANLGGE